MKKLLVILTIFLSFSAYAKKNSKPTLSLDQLATKVATSIDGNKNKIVMEYAEQFFVDHNENNTNPMASLVEGFYNVPDLYISFIIKTIGADSAIEETMAQKENEGKSLEQVTNKLFNQCLYGTDVTIAGKRHHIQGLTEYSNNASNGLLTFLELYWRSGTNNDGFNRMRDADFLKRLRTSLKLSELDQTLCLKVLDNDQCPTISSVEK